MENKDLKYSLPIEALEEKMISRQSIFDGHVLHVRKDTISLPNGKEATREYCHHNGAVCVIPITDDNEVICVRQYRYAMHSDVLEIPAGKLDYPEEDHNEAAIRELREETGTTCSKMTYLGEYWGSPAILDEKIYMYMAESLTFGETEFDEDEFIEIVKVPIDTLVEMVLQGKIPDGKTQTAILRANEILRRRK